MKNRILIFLTLLAVVVAGCGTSSKIVNFNPVKDRLFDTHAGGRFPYGVFLRTEKGRQIASMHYKDSSVIYNYDFTTGKLIDSICFESKLKMFSFHYLNDDSIFVYMNASDNPYYSHDSALFMIDKAGEIKQYYSFKGAPVNTSNSFNLSDTIMYAVSHFQAMNYSDNHVFFQLENSSENFNDILKTKFFPAGGQINLKTNTFKAHQIKSPYFPEGEFYSDNYKNVGQYVTAEGKLLYFFANTPVIYEYDYRTDKITEHLMKSSLVDSIRPSDSLQANYYKTHAAYKSIFYNPYKQQYYRILKLAPDENAPLAQKNIERYSLIVADKNFNKIGEGILPIELASLFVIFNEEGPYFFNVEKSRQSGGPVYTLVDLDFKKGDKAVLESQ